VLRTVSGRAAAKRAGATSVAVSYRVGDTSVDARVGLAWGGGALLSFRVGVASRIFKLAPIASRRCVAARIRRAFDFVPVAFRLLAMFVAPRVARRVTVVTRLTGSHVDHTIATARQHTIEPAAIGTIVRVVRPVITRFILIDYAVSTAPWQTRSPATCVRVVGVVRAVVAALASSQVHDTVPAPR
jgi:hypothetical protein